MNVGEEGERIAADSRRTIHARERRSQADLQWTIFRRRPVIVDVRRLKAMPIPDASRAVVEDEKVRDYLLNLSHADGGSKAAWFHSLGYNRDDWHHLATDLLAVAQNCTDFDTENTRFGVKYKARGSVGRPDHRPAKALTVWIVEDDDPPRLVTAYPDDKP